MLNTQADLAECCKKVGDHVSCSLLYEDRVQFIEYAEDTLFSDLHLDEIIAAVTVDLPGYDLGSIYRQKPLRVDDVLFRQAIVRDFYSSQLTDILDRFIQGLNLAKRYLNYCDHSAGCQQAAKWHLDSARIYCDSVECLATSLTDCCCQDYSLGVRRFAAWLEDYAGSPDFERLHTRVSTLGESMNSCRFALEVDIGNQIVAIDLDTDRMSYMDDLTVDFARYDLRDLRRETVAFADAQMNVLENQIWSVLGEDYPSMFAQLTQFRQDYPSFIEPHLLEFEREYMFYHSFLIFSRRLVNKGLPFSVPSLQEAQMICIHDGFDIALALKIDPSDLVLNDLIISADEHTLLLTGPNQGGKTTFSRMLGQTFFLASLGLPVPCRSAAIFPVNGIQTHFVKQETAGSLSGRLQDELLRLRQILMSSQKGCLIILNELFSSATTDDACEMARRVMKLLRKMNCLCLYVTHVHELAEHDLDTVTLVAGVSDSYPQHCTYRIMRSCVRDNASAQRLLQKYHLTRIEIEVRKNASDTVVCR